MSLAGSFADMRPDVWDPTNRQVPAELADYLARLETLVLRAVGDDLQGLWLIGSAAQGAYEHGVSDVDVLAVSGTRWPIEARRLLGAQLVHPALPCPAVGLEFVWYARPDLDQLSDPVAFQLNVNGGPKRNREVQLWPAGPNYWSVLDLAAARQVGVPLTARSPITEAVPRVPRERLRQAIRESVEWHDGPDAASPNRALNLARLLVLLEEDRWLSKLEAAALGHSRPALATVLDEALRARASGRRVDPALAEPLSELVRARLQ
jgi:hypothetical protein